MSSSGDGRGVAHVLVLHPVSRVVGGSLGRWRD